IIGDVPGPSIGLGAVLSLAMLGGVSSGVMVVGYMWLIHQVGPVRAAVVTYLMPPIGVALGFLVLDEQVGWSLAAGLVLVVLGVALVQQVPVVALVSRMRPGNAAPRPAASNEQ
ncbi:MAG: EamA family transporter, partial [Tepidiformaceae bacterium]